MLRQVKLEDFYFYLEKDIGRVLEGMGNAKAGRT